MDLDEIELDMEMMAALDKYESERCMVDDKIDQLVPEEGTEAPVYLDVSLSLPTLTDTTRCIINLFY
jgi:hypothetical protein